MVFFFLWGGGGGAARVVVAYLLLAQGGGLAGPVIDKLCGSIFYYLFSFLVESRSSRVRGNVSFTSQSVAQTREACCLPVVPIRKRSL